MVYLVLSLFCAMGVALFAVQNSHEVQVRFLGWQMHTSLAVLVIGAVAAGALLLGLLALFRQVGLGLRLRDEQSRARKAAADLEQARLAGQELRREIQRLQEHNRSLAARLAGAEKPGDGPGGGAAVGAGGTGPAEGLDRQAPAKPADTPRDVPGSPLPRCDLGGRAVG